MWLPGWPFWSRRGAALRPRCSKVVALALLACGLACRGPAPPAEAAGDAGPPTDDTPVVGEPPTARAASSTSGFVFPGDQITLSGSGDDPDLAESDPPLAMRWRQVSGGSVDLAGADSAQATFLVPDDVLPGDTLGFEFEVTDADGNRAADQVYLFVPQEGGVVLAIASGPAEPVEAGIEVRLSGSGSLNIPADSARYLWDQRRGPAVDLVDAETPTARFVAPELDEGEATLLFVLTLTNGEVRDTTRVEVTVVPAIEAPPEEGDAGDGGGEAPAGDDVAAGEAAYAAAGCAACHGDGAAGGSGPDLQGPDGQPALEARFAGGANHFGTTLSDEDIARVAAWLATLGG